MEPHLIEYNQTVRQALLKLNTLNKDSGLILFVLDTKKRLIGTITDGDIRRGLLNGMNLDSPLEDLMFRKFRFIQKHKFTLEDIKKLKKLHIELIPQLDKNQKLIKLIRLDKKKSILPIDVVIMAGGKGTRLKPITNNLPKPLIIVGSKPILEHNIDRLIDYGIETFFITVEHFKDQIINYFENGKKKDITINYIAEESPLGTIGSVKNIKKFNHNSILIMNSDLLTNIDFEQFFNEFITKNASMAVATVPYVVDIPYAVVETKNEHIIKLKEKPTYTYYVNAGIYLIKKSVLKYIPVNSFYNATDLIEKVIEKKENVIHFPILGYWNDIGRPADYAKAQKDIAHIEL